MSKEKPLNAEEERECFEFLKMLGVTHPEHAILSNKGYLAVFLSNLHPSQVGETYHPNAEEFRYLRKLLTQAGVVRLKEILRAHASELPPPPAPKVKDEKFSGDEFPLTHFKGPAPVHDDATVDESMQWAEKGNFHRKVRSFSGLDHESLDPEDAEEAITYIYQLRNEGRYSDAFYIAAETLNVVGLDEPIINATLSCIDHASRFDRDRGIGPVQMLHECENLAIIVGRNIPDMSKLDPKGTPEDAKRYNVVKEVYKAWTKHCRAVLEYRHRVKNDEWMHRQWVDPRDFGFLLDIVRLAVNCRMPEKLVKRLYMAIRHCIDVGRQVIAFEDKKGKFEAEILKIVCSPIKEAYPEATYEVYRDIAAAHLDEGDTATALLFINQMEVFRPDHKDIREMKMRLSEVKKQGRRINRSGGGGFGERWWELPAARK